MKKTDEFRVKARARLLDCGVRPSTQRVAIMSYLLAHYDHPTIDEVFTSLSPVIPTLSRTTVYNTLRLLSEVGAAQMITIDDHHVLYDGDITPHAHFLCRQCGKVKDFYDIPQMPEEQPHRFQDGCFIDEVQVYYKGVCEECRQLPGRQE